MSSSRLEAFSDGVLAIIITIMVLEIEPPEHYTLESLHGVLPQFLSYLVSFIYVGSYWNHHHHLFQCVAEVKGWVLWSNLHFLFWLSLVPVSTAWLGQSHEAFIPVLFYGLVLAMSAISFMLLHLSIAEVSGGSTTLIGFAPRKAIVSLLIYLFAMIISYSNTYVACAMYALVLFLWFSPVKYSRED
ncbi:TMEM175 family protein [uncultured Pseudoteredinibacter sp.]|uniref:TMEM175 family protein n=1 Tax=uncultured Pseudoteredinibacter sp. TaxID=1641701 RepID=UPI002638C267|nr:TMEM175 family protein [uncultured Pseudoteredinibacter sp.]